MQLLAYAARARVLIKPASASNLACFNESPQALKIPRDETDVHHLLAKSTIIYTETVQSDGLVRKTARGQVCSDHRPQSETHALLVLCALQLPTSPLHRKSKLLRCFNKVFPQCCGCIGPSNWCYGIDSSSGVTPQTFIISQTT